MKLFATILIVLLSLILSGQNYVKHNGQFVKVGGSFVKNSPQAAPVPYVYQAETEAFWARLTGTPSTEWKLDFDSLIIELKRDTILQEWDAWWCFAFENATDALLCVNDATFNASTNGTMTFQAKQGYTGSANGYMTTNYNPATTATIYALDDAGAGVYRRVANTNGGMLMACYGSTYIQMWNGYATINTTNTVSVDIALYTKLFYLGDRGTVEYYINDVFGGGGTINSTAVPNAVMTIFGTTVYGLYTADQFSIAFIGGALTSTQCVKLQDDIDNYLTRISDN